MVYIDLDEKFSLILTDNPWSYKNKNTGGSMKSGSAQKYPTMTVEELKALNVPDIAEKNSALFMWVPCPLKMEGMGIMKAWGFKYKTTIYWRKIMSLGMGFYYRGQVEECWVGIQGKVKAWRSQKPNIFQTKVREHSRKPDEIYAYTEETDLDPKIELFARQQWPGWTSWGTETDKYTPEAVSVQYDSFICPHL